MWEGSTETVVVMERTKSFVVIRMLAKFYTFPH